VLFAYIFSPWHLLIVIACICIIFPKKMFDAAKGLGMLLRQLTGASPCDALEENDAVIHPPDGSRVESHTPSNRSF
jgi:Sec-independent protein translocase protein TatA